MRLLVDTHAFLWFVSGDDRLSARARRRIEDSAHDKFLSVASIWEAAIKASLGKLTLAVSLDTVIDEGAVNNGIALLEVRREHAAAVERLPLHHRDPFDRLLVCQAMIEKMDVVSADAALDGYPIRRVW
ncbi:MAG TPA: type II toxin-antitoxin system VapC family toxin [Polyangia bacterium]